MLTLFRYHFLLATESAGLNVHNSFPVAALRANNFSLGETPYMTPSTTMGLHSIGPNFVLSLFSE